MHEGLDPRKRQKAVPSYSPGDHMTEGWSGREDGRDEKDKWRVLFFDCRVRTYLYLNREAGETPLAPLLHACIVA